MTTFLDHLNGSLNPVKSNQLLSSPRLSSHKHSREEFRSGDSPMESTDSCSLRSVISRPRKRFKPDLTSSKYRPYHGNSEDGLSDSCLQSPIPTQCAYQSESASTVHSSATPSTGDESSQGGNTGSGEEESEDGDGPNHPHRQDNKCIPDNNILHHPDKKCYDQDLGRKPLDEITTTQYQAAPTLSLTSCINQQNIESKAKRKAARKFGLAADLEKEAISQGYTIISDKSDSIVLRCPENHKVSLKAKDPAITCKKCNKKYAKCLEHAASHNGKVKNSRYQETITFECDKGHEWEIKYCKYMFTKWCPQCDKVKREEKKKTLEEESEKIRKENAAEQDAKLEEARLKMIEEERERYLHYQAWFYQWPQQLMYPGISSAACLTDESVNALAKEWTIKYLKENNGDAAFDDIFLMYKVLITSNEMLLAKMMLVPKAELSSFYRKFAVRLHPDKNKHPKSNEAFQKLTECYKFCTNSSH